MNKALCWHSYPTSLASTSKDSPARVFQAYKKSLQFVTSARASTAFLNGTPYKNPVTRKLEASKHVGRPNSLSYTPLSSSSTQLLSIKPIRHRNFHVAARSKALRPSRSVLKNGARGGAESGEKEEDKNDPAHKFWRLLGANASLGDIQDAFIEVIRGGQIHKLTTKQILRYGTRIHGVRNPEVLRDAIPETTRSIGAAVVRLRAVVDELETRRDSMEAKFLFQLDCLRYTIMALRGLTVDATRGIRGLLQAQSRPAFEGAQSVPMLYLNAITLLIGACRRADQFRGALEAVVFTWVNLRPHVLGVDLDRLSKDECERGDVLRDELFLTLKPQMDDAAGWYRSLLPLYSHTTGRVIGEILIRCANSMDLPQQMYAVLRVMEEHDMEVPERCYGLVLASLSEHHLMQAAEVTYGFFRDAVARSNKSDSFQFLFESLRYFSHKGDDANVERVSQRMVQLGLRRSEGVDVLRLHVHAVNRNLGSFNLVWEELFSDNKSARSTDNPRGRGTQRTSVPRYRHLAERVYAYANANDANGMAEALTMLKSRGFTPNRKVFTSIIGCLARQGDEGAVFESVQEMKTAGHEPDAVVYNILIRMHAAKGDIISAERVFQHAVDAGVRITQHLARAILSAHVSSASWRGVIRTFDWMRSRTNTHLWVDVNVLNQLLRAYVLVGAPLATVMAASDRYGREGVEANEITHLLLAQSACDARNYELASESILRISSGTRSHADVQFAELFGWTLLMGTFLRDGLKEEARGVFNSLQARGVVPDFFTYISVLKSYGNEGTENAIEHAEGFLQEMLDQLGTGKLRGDLQEALSRAYAPMLSMQARRANVAKVEQYYLEMTKHAPSSATVPILTTVMDAYRRNGDIQAVLHIWERIFVMAKEASADGAPADQSAQPAHDASPSQSLGQPSLISTIRFNANVLCPALSVLMSALTSAGKYLEIARIWNEVRSQGFIPDAHNWNHLAVALIHAGEVNRAFEVVEHIILPSKDRALKQLSERQIDPKSPLIFPKHHSISSDRSNRTESTDGEDNTPHPSNPTNMSDARAHLSDVELGRSGTMPRRDAFMYTTERVTRNAFNFEHHRSALDEQDDSISEPREKDLASELHTLYQVQPAWNAWKPHFQTRATMYKALAQLASGRLVQPLQSGGANQMPAGSEEENGHSEVTSALSLYETILKKYPRAVREVTSARKQLQSQQ